MPIKKENMQKNRYDIFKKRKFISFDLIICNINNSWATLIIWDYLTYGKTYGEIHKQPWFKEMIKKFDSGLKLYKQFHCRICKELWPTKFNRCETCLKNEHKYVTSNKMDPSLEKIPIEIRKIFEEATTLEQLLVSPIVPVMSIERLSSGHLKNSGYCASFVQDLQPLCTLLPRLPTEVSV